MAGMMVRADLMQAMGVIGPDDVQIMEAQARGVIGDQIERMDVTELVIRAQIQNSHASMIDIGIDIQNQIVEAVRNG